MRLIAVLGSKVAEAAKDRAQIGRSQFKGVQLRFIKALGRHGAFWSGSQKAANTCGLLAVLRCHDDEVQVMPHFARYEKIQKGIEGLYGILA